MPESLQGYTVGTTGAAWSRLESEVNPPLGLTREPVDSDSRAFLDAEDAIVRTGIQQGLMDLGYLADQNVDPSPIEMQQALADWQRDTRAYPATYVLTTPEGQTVTIDNAGLELDAPLPVLAVQTGFDGDLKLRHMPKIGASANLGARILQFRLRTFNRFDQTVDGLLAQKTIDTFERLHTHFSTLTDAAELNLTLLNRLGNAQILAQHFSHAYRKTVFVTKHHPVGLMAASTSKTEHFTIVQKQRINQRRGRLRTFSNYKKGAYVLVVDKRKRGDSLATLFASDLNCLGLELLQLRLWQQGYYTGALDADWGLESQKALDDFHATFIEANKPNTRIFKKQDFIAQVDGGQVVNLCYVFDELLGLADKTIDTMKHEDLSQITQEVFPDESATDQWASITEQATKANEQTQQAAEPVSVQTFRYGEARPNHRRRRKNFSRVGIFGAITGWFRRLKDNIKQVALQIRDAIIAGVESIRTFFRYAISKVKRVIRVVKVAIQRFYYWVASKPFGTGDSTTGEVLMTRWSIDFDTVNFASAKVSAQLINHHMDRIAFMNDSFHFVVKVALEVLSLMLKIAAGGLGLAYGIYQFIRSWPDWKEDNPFEHYLEPAYQY